MERILNSVMPSITRWFPGLIRMVAFRGPVPEQVRLLDLVTGYWTSQAISVGATIGLFDRIRSGQNIDELAHELKAQPDALERLVRALSGAGILRTDSSGKLTLTKLGALLTRDHPASLRAIAIACGQEWYRAWGELQHSVATGQSGFEKVYGRRFFDYIREHDAVRATFDEGMRGVSSMTDVPVAVAYDFSRFRHVTDIGGGTGSQLITVLRMNTRITGRVFDLPAVVDAAQKGVRAEPEVVQRLSFTAGDFMAGIPPGSDAYFMKSVLHDWSDEEAVKILRNCQAQMRPGSRLLIAEHVIQPGNVPQFGKFLDLMMLVNLGGKERTCDQYGRLLQQAGLRLTGEFPTLAQMTVLEAVPV